VFDGAEGLADPGVLFRDAVLQGQNHCLLPLQFIARLFYAGNDGFDFIGDFGGQFRLLECLLHRDFVVRRPHVVIVRDRDQELRVRLRRFEMRTVRHVRDQPAAVECRHRADAIRHRERGAHRERAAHAVTLRPHLAVLRHRRLLIQPRNERFRIGNLRRLVQRLRKQWR